MAILFEVARIQLHKYYLFCQNFLTPTLDKRVIKANSLLSPILSATWAVSRDNEWLSRQTNKQHNKCVGQKFTRSVEINIRQSYVLSLVIALILSVCSWDPAMCAVGHPRAIINLLRFSALHTTETKTDKKCNYGLVCESQRNRRMIVEKYSITQGMTIVGLSWLFSIRYLSSLRKSL